MKAVFAQPPSAGGEGCDQTDLHSSPALLDRCKGSGFDVLSREDVGGQRDERNRFKHSEFSLDEGQQDMAKENRLGRSLGANSASQPVL
jgi:hypothetical protein